jgi:hypothetical protein
LVDAFVQITLPKKEDNKNEKVRIVGPADQVKNVASAVQSLVTFNFSELTHEGWSKIEVDFPAQFRNSLIGPKGQTIKSIQGNTKCRIETDNLSKTDKVLVCGPGGMLAQAKKEILRVKEKCEQAGAAEASCADGFEDPEDNPRDNLW